VGGLSQGKVRDRYKAAQCFKAASKVRRFGESLTFSTSEPRGKRRLSCTTSTLDGSQRQGRVIRRSTLQGVDKKMKRTASRGRKKEERKNKKGRVPHTGRA